jgi:predicted MFS family arabinose efflux permease
MRFPMADRRPPQTPPSGAPPEAPDAYAWYVLGVLFLLYVIAYIDRQVMSVLLHPIKQEFGVSDTAMGFLSGIAFAIFYVCVGVPIARWSDRGVRRSIIALAVAVWSAMTALTGAAQSYAHLLLARIGVGIGEAGGGAPAHSLVSDYFPPARRATALGILTTGGGIGMMLGLALGGWLGDRYGWRFAFVALGLPGLAVAVLVRTTVREPPRGRFDAGASRRAGDETTASVVRYLWAFRSFRWLTLAATLHVFAGYGAATWNPTFLVRVHGMTLTEAGFWLGPITGVCSGAGAVLWGMLADRLGRRDERWYMRLPAIGSLAALPFAYGFVLWPGALGAVLFLVPSSLLGNCYTGATFAMTQGLARPHMRALAAAFILLVMNLLGFGLGPLIVGAMNDWLAPRYGLAAIRYSLLIIALPHLLAAAMNLLAARSLREDLAVARQG